jgi:hypothetical protein
LYSLNISIKLWIFILEGRRDNIMAYNIEGVETGIYPKKYTNTASDDGKSSGLLSGSVPYNKSGRNNITIDFDSDYFKSIYHNSHLFRERELDIYNKTYRFGYFANNTMSAGREYLFFTKPDLNILDINTGKLNSSLADIPFWQDLYNNRIETILALQNSAPNNANVNDIFCHLLQNQVTSSLDIPNLSATMIETPTNDYGVGYMYRGSSESSDDNPEFSLEFKDNKWLSTYSFFKAYELYETMKHHGTIAPRQTYIENKILHDQFAIYKFIVAEDMETIVYYGKMYGVTPKSLPRDAFSSATFENGISYSIDFQAAFYEDMIPEILSDFNYLSKGFYDVQPYDIENYNEALGNSDGRAATAAIVKKYESSKSPSGFVYKLKWRGKDTV